jgi:hypothetical protein
MTDSLHPRSTDRADETRAPIADYCAACGAKAPERPAQDDAAHVEELRDRGWLCVPSRSLRRGDWPRKARNCMCPHCLQNPTPFARRLLRVWGLAS